GQRRRGRRQAQHVGVVLLVRREDVYEHLHLVLEPFREQRPDRAVDPARREDLFVRGAALTLQKAAGNLAGGVGLLAIFDGQRKEREGRDVVRHRRRGEHDRLPELQEAGARGLFGQAARLELQRAARVVAFSVFHHI